MSTRPLPFTEAIKLERSFEPLGEYDSPSARVRRRLLLGETLGAKAVSRMDGVTNGFLGTTMLNMKDWGFEFEKVEGDEEDAARYRLTNRFHVPTTKTVRERVPRVKVTPPPDEDDDWEIPEGFTLRNRNTRRGMILKRLLDGELLSTGMVAEMGFDRENLRKVARDLEACGYTVQHGQHPTQGMTYVVTGKARRSKSTALAKRDSTPAVPSVGGELMGTPLPALDQELQVYLLYRDPETDEVKVGVRNGSESWLLALEAHINDDEEADAVAH